MVACDDKGTQDETLNNLKAEFTSPYNKLTSTSVSVGGSLERNDRVYSIEATIYMV